VIDRVRPEQLLVAVGDDASFRAFRNWTSPVIPWPTSEIVFGRCLFASITGFVFFDEHWSPTCIRLKRFNLWRQGVPSLQGVSRGTEAGHQPVLYVAVSFSSGPLSGRTEDTALTRDRFGLTEETASGLRDEGSVGMNDASGVQLDDERRVVRHESPHSPDLRREEVRRHERRPVRLESCAPRHRACRPRKACRLQDARDRRSDVMAHVLQSASNPRIAQVGLGVWPSVPRSHDARRQPDAARTGAAVDPLPGDQLAMAEFREAPTLVVLERKPTSLKMEPSAHNRLREETRSRPRVKLSSNAQHG
jgi:hypothetical protein